MTTPADDSPPDFRPFNPEGDLFVSRRRLPHWDQPGAMAFITFRQDDSIPAPRLQQWRRERAAWLKEHQPPLNPAEWRDYNRLFNDRMQGWLDQGHGSCRLRDPAAAEIVAGAFHFFDGQRYWLDDFVVMPNHVHLLALAQGEPGGLSGLLHSWKSFTANQINRHFGLGGAFWMSERFDHLVRSQEQFEFYRRYIRENPAKAGLPKGSFLLGGGRFAEGEDQG